MPKTPSPEPDEVPSGNDIDIDIDMGTGKDKDKDGSAKYFAGHHDDFGLTPKPKEPKVKAQRADPLLGVDLGGVKIVRLIGEGGMGRVYEALQDKPARTVAVKIIRAGITSEKTMKRFEREAEFLGKLQHPGIAQIFIVGTYESDLGSVPFYVMEFLANAKPLTNYAHDHGLPLRDKLQLFKQVCEAVSHGHDRSIVHRDLKPGNILVDAAGNPKVIDFGVARSTDSDLALEAIRTDTGQMIGTVQYMAPEQFGPNPDDLNSRTDVYALGVVLYELISGVPPYSVSKRALHEASRVVCEQVPTPLRSLDKSIPRDVSAICERCLQKSPRHRYHSAGELAADIGRFLAGQPVRAKPSGLRLPESLRSLKDNNIRAVVLLGGVALIGWWLVGRGASKSESGPHVQPPAPNQAPGPVRAPAGPAVNNGPSSPSSSPSRPPESQEPFPAIPPPPPAPRPEPPREPQVALLEASSEWTKSDLIVREGDCYRITVTGECRDSSGRTFSPDGPTSRDKLTPLGAPKQVLSNRAHWELFTHNVPRQMLMARAGDSATLMAVGSGFTFISPGDGELAFRLNDRRLSNEGSRGRLSIELVPVARPEFVGPDGTTTVITRVAGVKSLVFEPDGLRWEYASILSDEADEYPVLINGIRWWPERDVTKFTRSTLLRTGAFSWAVGPDAVEPEVILPPGLNNSHAEVSPGVSRSSGQSLKFSDPEQGVNEIHCVISRRKWNL
jgi:serine/threonine protein kinase